MSDNGDTVEDDSVLLVQKAATPRPRAVLEGLAASRSRQSAGDFTRQSLFRALLRNGGSLAIKDVMKNVGSIPKPAMADTISRTVHEGLVGLSKDQDMVFLTDFGRRVSLTLPS